MTAVEFLAERYNYITWMRNRDEISAGTADEWRYKFLKEAKEMEEQQLNKAWRDPKKDLPELLPNRDYSNNVLAQVEGFTGTQVMGLLYVPDDEGRWGHVWGNCYGDINGEAEWDDDYEVIGWKPIE